ncbi:serine protease, partial [Methylobacterium sp. WL18]
FRVAVDPASGAAIGVPERLLSKRTALPAGTRWQSADGRVTLESRAIPPGGETVDGLFDQLTVPLPTRKVTYKLRRPDSLVVTAETGTGLSYVRYDAGPQGVRGFLIGYDRALAAEVGRLVIAVANAFEPFPTAAAPGPAKVAADPPPGAAAA